MHMIHWEDLQNGERFARGLASILFLRAMSPNAVDYIRKTLRHRRTTMEERFALGICSVAFATLIYMVTSVTQSFVGHDTWVTALPIVAGMIMLFGYYQGFLAWRGAYVGKINGFAWVAAGAIFVLFIIGVILSTAIT